MPSPEAFTRTSDTGFAVFDPAMRYRYLLRRDGFGPPDGPRVAWIMLNPSTADECDDDPTIRRVVKFSRRWGFSSAEVVNLYALRSSSPYWLADRSLVDAVGPACDHYLTKTLDRAGFVVCAWGSWRPPAYAHGGGITRAQHDERVAEVRRLVGDRARVLGFGSLGPLHPLARGRSRPGDDTDPIPWAAP